MNLFALQSKFRLLTEIDVFPNTPQYQFIRADTDTLEYREEYLDETIKNAIALCQTAISASGLAGQRTKFGESELDALRDVEMPHLPKTPPIHSDRGYHLIRETLERELGNDTRLGDDLNPVSLLRRVAAFLYARFKEDFVRLEDAVRQSGIEDPIVLEADRVVPLGAATWF